MSSTKIYREFLDNNFKDLKIEFGLFYDWRYGLRFELGVGNTSTDAYFEDASKRAATISESIFSPTDTINIVLIDFKYKRRKIRFSNFLFKQIKSLNKSEVKYFKMIRNYSSKEKDILNTAIVEVKAERLNWLNVFKAIAHSDFPSRQPRLDDQPISRKAIFFINIDRKVILNMYDDRGLDVIASNKNTLSHIYNKHNNWLLNYDRARMEKTFNPNSLL